MPRDGYRTVVLEDVARTDLGEFKRQASARLGRDLTLSDAAGVAVVLAHQATNGDLQTALEVYLEFRRNARRNR